MLDFFKKLAIKSILDKAEELHKTGLSVEQIAGKFWDKPKVYEGLNALGIRYNELVKMIKDKVKE